MHSRTTMNAAGSIPGAPSTTRSRRPRMADVQASQNKVQLAASHWKPRFTANGIDVNDFEKVVAATTEWKDWGPRWLEVGDAHRSLAEEADAKRRNVTATEAYQRAAWRYHLGKFLWL